MKASRRRSGLALMGVLFFVLLSVSGLATFLGVATLDRGSVYNRDLSARCEALARGGVRLATVLLLQDRLDEARDGLRVESAQDPWQRAAPVEWDTPDGTVRIRIEDAGTRLDLNALFADGAPRSDLTETLLVTLLDKVVGEMPERPGRPPYDTSALAQALVDYVDADDVSQTGDREDEAYQQRAPGSGAANRPLLSVDELGLVAGFDQPLVEALRPYVGVYPLAGGNGINPNTAPPWVLALLFHGTGGDFRLADKDTVRHILELRENGAILCADDADNPACTKLRDAVDGEVYPPPTFSSEVFRVSVEARAGSVRRTVEAVVDRSDPEQPAVLAWSLR